MAIVLLYVHFPPSLRTAIHHTLLHGLRENGLLIIEAFHPTQLGRPSGGPKDVSMLYTLEQLRGDLASVPDATFDEIVAIEQETILDEGPGHRGPAYLTRLVAQKRVAR